MLPRRDALLALMALAGAPLLPRAAAAQTETNPAPPGEPGLQLTGEAVPFSRERLVEMARDRAAEPFSERPSVPEAWQSLNYDQYRAIWFDPRNGLWRDTDAPVRVDVFPPGLYYARPVRISAVENGEARRIGFDMGVFDTTDGFPEVPVDDSLGYSGLRLRAELETPGIFTEFLVMQGASYFRGIGTGEIYGLSARGLGIDTAERSGEEFPEFTDFWIERPAPEQEDIVVHALLDGRSATGAYTFRIRPGATLEIHVEAEIFARRELAHIGLAPLTSMFLYDRTNRERFSDFRPAVHDSDGLMIRNGAGETLWRPLANPQGLQISSFADRDPKGFGLMQRHRRFRDFADLEALYHRRPSLWIEPGEAWGTGVVALVEIPTDKEIFDNIVAYWRPDTPLAAGSSRYFTYRMRWGADPADTATAPLARVLETAIGRRPDGGHIAVIDFAATPDLPEDLGTLGLVVRASAGTTDAGILQRNPETGGPRLAFSFDPGDAEQIEFRVQIRKDDAPFSEVWLYRWTA